MSRPSRSPGNPDHRDDEKVTTLCEDHVTELHGLKKSFGTHADDHRNGTRHGEARHRRSRFIFSSLPAGLSSPILRTRSEALQLKSNGGGEDQAAIRRCRTPDFLHVACDVRNDAINNFLIFSLGICTL